MRLCAGLKMRSRLWLLLLAGVAQVGDSFKIGAEFTDRPWSMTNILPIAYGQWLAPHADGNNTPAALDGQGWPTEDAYVIVFDFAPWQFDPAQYIPPSIFGNYTLIFKGKATLTLAPGISATVSAVAFDERTWSTAATITVYDAAPLLVPGLAVGFFGSYRNSIAPVGTGVTDVQLYCPGCYSGDSNSVFTSDTLLAVQPFSHLRMMTALGTNSPFPLGQSMEWSDRRLWSDALWGTAGIPRPNTIASWPWEAAILLGQAIGASKGLWVNVHVACSGASPADTDSYVYQLALLLRDGNSATGGMGLPQGQVLYVEHGNEVWLNGTVGGPDISYLWNYDAAGREVAAGGSVLNADGCQDPAQWAQRRHVKRLREIHSILDAVLTPAGIEVRMVYGWYQNYIADADAALAWAVSTYSSPPSSFLYGLAVNSYYIGYIPPGGTTADITQLILLASDALGPPRLASSALVAKYNLTSLLSYEGMGLGLPDDGNGDNSTWQALLTYQRGQEVAEVLKYDVEVNWAGTPGANEYNFFALSGMYGPWPIVTWGLTECLCNLNTTKYQAAVDIASRQDRRR